MREEEDDECIGCKSFKFCLSKWKKYIACDRFDDCRRRIYTVVRTFRMRKDDAASLYESADCSGGNEEGKYE